jgi:hypothetical protein
MKEIAVSATFSYEGVPFEERFASVKRFISFCKRNTRYAFINAVDYANNDVIHKTDLSIYISKYSKK